MKMNFTFGKVNRIQKVLLATGMLLGGNNYTSAQSINGPDTVLVGTSASFNLSGANDFISYAWEFETSTFSRLLTNAVPIPNTGTNGSRFSISASACMVFDSRTNAYFSFVSCASSGFTAPNVQRVDFGPDPGNPAPSTVNLGNPGNIFVTNAAGFSNMEDIKIVKDGEGVFHAFINNGGVVHWVFGNGIDQPPTQSARIFSNPAVLGMSMNMAVVHYNNGWHLFTGQTFGTSPGLVRLDLGADLNSIPAVIPFVIFQVPNGGSGLGYLAILKTNNNWSIHMTANNSSSPLYRYDFGTSLLNAAPVVTDLGTTNPPLNKNRALSFVKTCDSFYMLGLNEGGDMLAFDFQNNITATPSVQNLGQKFTPGQGMQALYPYWYKDTLWSLSTGWFDNPVSTLYRFPLAKMDHGNTVISYYNSVATHTFNSPGLQTVTLYCDQGDNRGPQAFCKTVFVKNPPPNAIDAVNGGKNSIALFPNPARNTIQVNIPENGVYSYAVSDVQGRQWIKAADVPWHQGDQPVIVIRDLAEGFYYLKLKHASGAVYTAKFIKQ